VQECDQWGISGLVDTRRRPTRQCGDEVPRRTRDEEERLRL